MRASVDAQFAPVFSADVPQQGKGGHLAGQQTTEKRFNFLWVGVAVVVVGVFGSMLVNNLGGDPHEQNVSTSKVESPTDPPSLAASLQVPSDRSFKDQASYRRLSAADFKKFMYPSGDLVQYPYPYVGERIVIYGRVDEVASNFYTTTGATYFESTAHYEDLGPVVGWSAKSADLPILGWKADLGNLEKGDNLEIFVEVRRPYLTGAEVFSNPLRKPFLVAHIVRVIR